MIDIVPEVIAALRSPAGVVALQDAIGAIVAKELRAVLAERDEKLQPIGSIVGCKSDAARKRLVRDPELRKLGIQIGRRLFFKRSDVENYYRERSRR